MRSLVRPLARVGKEYRVVLRSGRIEYRSTCYAKAVGVHDYLEARAAKQEIENKRAAKEFSQSHKVSHQ